MNMRDAAKEMLAKCEAERTDEFKAAIERAEELLLDGKGEESCGVIRAITSKYPELESGPEFLKMKASGLGRFMKKRLDGIIVEFSEAARKSERLMEEGREMQAFLSMRAFYEENREIQDTVEFQAMTASPLGDLIVKCGKEEHYGKKR